jgi:uncharacterized protein
MYYVRVVNETRTSVLGGRIRMADRLLSRLRGFLFRKRPQRGEGLFLAPCRGVHMYGMRFPLDVVLVDQQGVVIAVHEALQPGTRTPVYAKAASAIELPTGAIAATRTAVGDRLSWSPSTSATVEWPAANRELKRAEEGSA